MSVAGMEVKKGPPFSPPQGAADGPVPPYPTTRRSGRRRNGAFLPRGGRLPPSRSAGGAQLRASQEPLELGDLHPRPLPAAQGRRERALVPARGRAVLRAPVPGRLGAVAFLFQPPRARAAALLGAPAPLRVARVGGRPGDADRRLDAARGAAPQAGRPA